MVENVKNLFSQNTWSQILGDTRSRLNITNGPSGKSQQPRCKRRILSTQVAAASANEIH